MFIAILLYYNLIYFAFCFEENRFGMRIYICRHSVYCVIKCTKKRNLMVAFRKKPLLICLLFRSIYLHTVSAMFFRSIQRLISLHYDRINIFFIRHPCDAGAECNGKTILNPNG